MLINNINYVKVRAVDDDSEQSYFNIRQVVYIPMGDKISGMVKGRVVDASFDLRNFLWRYTVRTEYSIIADLTINDDLWFFSSNKLLHEHLDLLDDI